MQKSTKLPKHSQNSAGSVIETARQLSLKVTIQVDTNDFDVVYLLNVAFFWLDSFWIVYSLKVETHLKQRLPNALFILVQKSLELINQLKLTKTLKKNTVTFFKPPSAPYKLFKPTATRLNYATHARLHPDKVFPSFFFKTFHPKLKNFIFVSLCFFSLQT